MDEKLKDIQMNGDFEQEPSVTQVLEVCQYDESPLSEDMAIFQVCEVPELKDPYVGKEVSLNLEGGQEVFYHGRYVTKIVLHGEPLLVGKRDVMAGHYPDIDLAMYWKQDRSVSRRHLRIYRDMNGKYFVEDVCQRNATFLNSYQRPLNRERVELKDGDRILVSTSVAICFRVR